MKYMSLFSGIGGFELGIEQAHELYIKEKAELIGSKDAETIRGPSSHPEEDRYSGLGGHINPDMFGQPPECVGFSEIFRPAIQIYEKHFKHKNFGDITRIEASTLPAFDLLVGGFPCQSFSIAGKRGGFNDTRGTLFFEIARIVKEKQPRLLLLENVKGLLSHDQGKTFYTIISTLDGLGYDLQWQVLNSQHFDVPQNRQRVFIVGHLRGTPRPQVFPIFQTGTPLIAQKQDGFCAATLTAEGAATIGKTGVNTIAISAGGIRTLTPVECERLQGFPDGWTEFGACKQKELVWNGVININAAGQRAPRMISAPSDGVYKMVDGSRYHCLGNAVTTNVICAIMERLLKTNQ